jgi:hypothetical protein
MMLYETITFDGSTTFPSGLHLHFPDRVYSTTTLHSQIKWPESLQKLQTLSPPSSAPIGVTLALMPLGLVGPACCS